MEECNGLTVVQPKWIQEVLESYCEVAEAQDIIKQLSLDASAIPNITLQKWIIRINGLIWVGSIKGLSKSIIEKLHATPWGGHSGITATKKD